MSSRASTSSSLPGSPRRPSRLVKAPRVAESPVAFECTHFQTVRLPGDDGSADNYLVIGRVVGIHIDDRFIDDGRVNTAAMRPIARLGYSEYAVDHRSLSHAPAGLTVGRS
jgi:flavin reductase (DIM6/NTAB) family NADH-FMN oxidoreductase RutF